MVIDRDGVQLGTLFLMGAYDSLRTCRNKHNDEEFKAIKHVVRETIKQLQAYMEKHKYATHLEDYFSPELAHEDIVDLDPTPAKVEKKPVKVEKVEKSEKKVRITHVSRKRTPTK